MPSTKRQLNIRITEGGQYALRQLAAHYNASQAFVIDWLLRQQLRTEGLDQIGDTRNRLGKVPPKVTLAGNERTLFSEVSEAKSRTFW